ncbi:isopentenyl-diphosphate Delta-isomerase [Marimonas arenosa]|uniref:Isopentenyl-diphosphate Delta-isomerase n=1 Tax=Marimonas arenosa TaxID=1795305 RepID=A0AAE4B573_9RHOB|nr:isopentenyl-diphosphate Delta-isomerase [Marimonas arenosa]MDQ2090847.1 isopentenyl-diphosphate Delta-isomerase [Marimonas arenosa]
MDSLIPAWIDNRLTPFDKLETHRLGLRHKAVSVFVMRGDQTLIQRRALTKYHTPGLWANSCCTHPFWEEASHVCAVRRLKEELGIDELDLKSCGTVEYRADVGAGLTEHEVVSVFRGDVTEAIDITPNPSEVMDVRWVGLDELTAEISVQPEIFTPWLKIYLQRHLDLILKA